MGVKYLDDILANPASVWGKSAKELEDEINKIEGINASTGDSSFIPFLYQGQYYDEEIGLAYNRFRYYSPENGTYISQDPIRLAGNKH